MARFDNLKAAIEAAIYENGTQAITGDILQDVLKDMVDSLGEGATWRGIASPATDPGQPDGGVIYLAYEAGSYTHFGGNTLAAGETAIFAWDGTSWEMLPLPVLQDAAGVVKTGNIADGAVTSGKIAGEAVTEGKIGAGAVTSGKIADGAVSAAKVADGAVGAAKIADGAVGTAKLASGAVTEGKIGAGAVTESKLASGAVTEGKIAADAVTESKIHEGAVTNTKLGSNAVTSAKIASSAVLSSKIADGAVGTAKLAQDAVTADKLASNAVTEAKIANGSVSRSKLAGSITSELDERIATADSDHTRAEQDHARATADHTTAAADHVIAQSDHSTASADHTASVAATAAATAASEAASEAAEAADEAREAIQDDLAAKANKDGYYDTLGAGYAKNLLGTGASAPAKFTFRPSGGTADIADGIATLKAIKGKTIVWNQLGGVGLTRTSHGITLTNEGDGLFSVQGTADSNTSFNLAVAATRNSHAIFLGGIPTGASADSYYVAHLAIGQTSVVMVSDTIRIVGNYAISWYLNIKSGTTFEDKMFFRPQFVDLTVMFGAGNEPSSVEEFEAMFPLDYYAYNAGQLLSFAGTGLKTIGFNAYKHSAAAAEVIGGMQYQVTGAYTALTLDGEAVTPDASGIFTPAKTGTLAVTGGDSTTTCIHLVHSGTLNGEYKPYEEHLLTLPITTMTGKLNGEGESVTIFPNGMRSAGSVHDELVRDASGNFVKAIVATGTRTYQEGDEDDSTLATDGTNTIYPLTTPQEYILDEPIPTAYQVSDWGTEQLLPVNDDEPTTAPINADIIYGPNVQDAVRRLPLMYLSIADYKTGIANLASALGASLGKTIAVAWGGDNGSVPTFTITDNAE